jgi:nicotinamidase-related amidase
VLQEWTWGTENIEWLDVQGDDLVFSKNTVSIFSGAWLYEYLKQNEIRDLYFAWCSTNLAIESSVRAAHDYNFSCHVCSSCCAAADLETHKNSLQNLSPLAKIL